MEVCQQPININIKWVGKNEQEMFICFFSAQFYPN